MKTGRDRLAPESELCTYPAALQFVRTDFILADLSSHFNTRDF